MTDSVQPVNGDVREAGERKRQRHDDRPHESGIEQDNLGKTIDEIINQLNLLKKGELSERDVEEAKEFMVQGSKSVSDSLGQVCDWYTLRFPIRVDETPEEFASSVSKLTRDDILNCSSKIYLDTVYTIVRGE